MEWTRQAKNRRRRAREGPEPACVQTRNAKERHTREREGKVELTSCLGTVKSARQKTSSESYKEEVPGLPARVSGRHVVRERQSSLIPAQASRVSVAVRGAPG